jgi:hypothetical protein
MRGLRKTAWITISLTMFILLVGITIASEQKPSATRTKRASAAALRP